MAKMSKIGALLMSLVPECFGQLLVGPGGDMKDRRGREHIWLELTRTGIPIRRMSPKRLHSRTSHALSVDRNCMGFFASGQKLPRGR